MHRPGRAKTGSEVIDAYDEESVRIDRFAGTYHVVPPPDIAGLVRIGAGDVVRRVQCMTYQHGIRLVTVESAISFIHQRIAADSRAALQLQRLGKIHRFR